MTELSTKERVGPGPLYGIGTKRLSAESHVNSFTLGVSGVARLTLRRDSPRRARSTPVPKLQEFLKSDHK
jgi:hypothetical protein